MASFVTTKAKSQKTIYSDIQSKNNNNFITQKIPVYQNNLSNNQYTNGNNLNQSSTHFPYDTKYKFFKNEVILDL